MNVIHILRHNLVSSRVSAARLLLVAPVALLVAACGGAEQEATAATDTTTTPVLLTPAEVAVAGSAEITSGVLLSGTLEPERRVLVTAQAAGVLGELTVDRGSRVGAGQRIGAIQAEGVRSQAAGARAGVDAAEAQLEVARIQRDAARRLFQAGAMSRVDYENAVAAFRAAEAQVAVARANATAAGEAAGYTIVKSPINGTVSNKVVEAGQIVRPGDEIVTIVNTSALELAGNIPVDQAGKVSVGQPVSFTIDAFPGREFRGTVARKDPAANPSTRQVGIYVRLPNPNGEITAGQFARGQVAGDRATHAVTVPITAVMTSGAESSVIVIDNGALARRTVTVGARDEAAGRVAIMSGIAAGDSVLVRPNAQTPMGQPVLITGEQRTSAPTSNGAESADSAKR